MPYWSLNYWGARRSLREWRYPGTPIPRRLQRKYHDPSMQTKKR